MALRFIDSYDHYYSDNNNLPRKYGFVVGSFDTVGRESTHSGGGAFMRLFFEPQDTWILGKAFKIGSSEALFGLNDDSDYKCQLDVTSDGNLHFYNFGPSGNVYTTGLGLNLTLPYCAYFIELKFHLHATDGYYEIRVNNIPVLSATGINTVRGLASATIIQTWCMGDDYYVCDGTGTVNNDFLGDRRSIAVMPAAVGSVNDWTPNTAIDNWDINNDKTYTAATIENAYVETDTDMAMDLYTFEDVTIEGTVAGVQLSVLAKKTDADFRQIRLVMDIDGTKYYGDWQTLTDDWKYYKWIWETDPSISGAWTRTKINDHCTFGFQYKNS